MKLLRRNTPVVMTLHRRIGCEIQKQTLDNGKASAKKPDNIAVFADNWIASWNSHNLSNIMTHYSADVEITTPMLKKILGDGSDGTIKGKAAVQSYWANALEKIPDLKFELIDVTESVDSVALYYKSVFNKRSVEVMYFDEHSLVRKIVAHYSI